MAYSHENWRDLSGAAVGARAKGTNRALTYLAGADRVTARGDSTSTDYRYPGNTDDNPGAETGDDRIVVTGTAAGGATLDTPRLFSTDYFADAAKVGSDLNDTGQFEETPAPTGFSGQGRGTPSGKIDDVDDFRFLAPGDQIRIISEVGTGTAKAYEATDWLVSKVDDDGDVSLFCLSFGAGGTPPLT